MCMYGIKKHKVKVLDTSSNGNLFWYIDLELHTQGFIKS